MESVKIFVFVFVEGDDQNPGSSGNRSTATEQMQIIVNVLWALQRIAVNELSYSRIILGYGNSFCDYNHLKCVLELSSVQHSFNDIFGGHHENLFCTNLMIANLDYLARH